MPNVQIARFSEIKSQGPRFAAELDLPLAAYQKMTAEECFLILSSPELGGPFATDPGISDAQGLVAAIVKCSPGQGPYLHAHYNTLENFVALDGFFRIFWGDTGEYETIIEPLDMVSVPRGVVRAFANASDKPAHILAFIRGNTPEEFSDVAMTPAAADDLLQTFGDGTVDKIKEIGWRFDASVDAPTAQVSPADMEAQIARFARLTAKDMNHLATYAMMAPEGVGAAVAGDPGLYANILEIAPGTSSKLAGINGKRNLMALTGRIIAIREGTEEMLSPWDMATLPDGASCRLANPSDEPARLLSIEVR